VNDCAKKNQGPHEIKRLGLYPLNELGRDAGNLLVMIFLHRFWKMFTRRKLLGKQLAGASE